MRREKRIPDAANPLGFSSLFGRRSPRSKTIPGVYDFAWKSRVSIQWMRIVLKRLGGLRSEGGYQGRVRLPLNSYFHTLYISYSFECGDHARDCTPDDFAGKLVDRNLRVVQIYRHLRAINRKLQSSNLAGPS